MMKVKCIKWGFGSEFYGLINVDQVYEVLSTYTDSRGNKRYRIDPVKNGEGYGYLAICFEPYQEVNPDEDYDEENYRESDV